MFSSTVASARTNPASRSRPANSTHQRPISGTSAAGATSAVGASTSATVQPATPTSAERVRQTATSYHDLDYASQQKIMRAVNILGNSGLLMKYALENDLSIPQARHYFEQVAGGGNPKPIIKTWFPF